MARIPENVIYRFYGYGIPQFRAIKFMSIHNVAVSAPRVKDGRLSASIACRKQRHTGSLLLKLALGLFEFCSIRQRRFQWITEQGRQDCREAAKIRKEREAAS